MLPPPGSARKRCGVSRRADGPSLLVVAAGGFGVLVVLAFVLAVGLGGGTRSTPGELVRVVRSDGPAGMAVLAGRCLDQRVTDVTVLDEADAVVWRIVSRKGSIERRYVVGGGAPLGFDVVQPLTGPPTGTVRAEVTFRRDGEETTDARSVRVADLPEQGAALAEGAPACGGDEGAGGTAVLFAVAAAFVVAGYGAMLLRARGR